MRHLIRKLLVIVTLTFSASAFAVPVTIDYTADNAVLTGGICVDAECTQVIGLADFATIFADGSEPNADDWTNADTVVLDLAPGTYGFAFIAENFTDPAPSSTNPAGFLAQILWQGFSNVTSSAWEVTVDGVTWTSATEWAQNGTGIWGGNLLGEISSDAYWLWNDVNFSSDTLPSVSFRTSITVVPEPGTLGLLGLGLLGLGIVRRRRVSA